MMIVDGVFLGHPVYAYVLVHYGYT